MRSSSSSENAIKNHMTRFRPGRLKPFPTLLARDFAAKKRKIQCHGVLPASPLGPAAPAGPGEPFAPAVESGVHRGVSVVGMRVVAVSIAVLMTAAAPVI